MGMRSGLQVLRLRDFRLVFGASVVSLLGDGVAPLALTFAVLDLTGSASDLGYVLAARTVALVGSLLIGGVVADRVSRRKVMIAADLARLVAQGAIGALLVAGRASVPEIAVSQAAVGAATGFFNPASSGFMPTVAGDWLQQANSLRGIAMAAGGIAGPALAGALVVTTSPGVTLLIDAASFAASAGLLVRVRRDPRAASTQHFIADLRDGFTEVRSRTWLWTVILAASVINLAGVGFPVLGAVIAKRDLGGAGALALILASGGVGSLIGGSALLRLRPRRPLLVAVVVGILPVAQMPLLALVAPLPLIALAALAGGIGSLVFNTLWETTLQEHVPESARSRVSAYDWCGSLAFTAIGYALVGPLAAGVGVSSALYICAAVELAAVSSLLAVGEIRTLTAA
jgi:predicted MFS family arabinose efflux permease